MLFEVVLSTILFFLGKAIVNRTGSTDRWKGSMFESIAIKRGNPDDKKYNPQKSYWGPRNETYERQKGIGANIKNTILRNIVQYVSKNIFPLFIDIYSTGNFILTIGVMYLVFGYITSDMSFWMGLYVSGGMFLFSMIGYHFLNDYTFMTKWNPLFRFAFVAVMVLTLIYSFKNHIKPIVDKDISITTGDYKTKIDELNIVKEELTVKLVRQNEKTESFKVIADSIQVLRDRDSLSLGVSLSIVDKFLNMDFSSEPLITQVDSVTTQLKPLEVSLDSLSKKEEGSNEKTIIKQ